GGDGVQPVLAGRPGSGAQFGRHRPGPGDLAGGRTPARGMAPGVGRARRRCAVPVDPSPPRGRHADPQPDPAGPAGRLAPRPRRRRPPGSRWRRRYLMSCRIRTVRPVLAGLVGLVAALVCAGCLALPESGPVETGGPVAGQEVGDAPYFSPPPPAEGASPVQLAAGFIRAMEANPVTTAVARGYLTNEAARAWRPDRGTIVYSSFSVES